jgi:hypothetical protein
LLKIEENRKKRFSSTAKRKGCKMDVKVEKLLVKPVAGWNVDECIVYLTASDASRAKLKGFESCHAARKKEKNKKRKKEKNKKRKAVGRHLKALTKALSSDATNILELAMGSQVVAMLQHMAAKSTPQVLDISPIRCDNNQVFWEDMAATLLLLRAMPNVHNNGASAYPTTEEGMDQQRIFNEVAMVYGRGSQPVSRRRGGRTRSKKEHDGDSDESE